MFRRTMIAVAACGCLVPGAVQAVPIRAASTFEGKVESLDQTSTWVIGATLVTFMVLILLLGTGDDGFVPVSP